MKILCLGDSTTYGFGVPRSQAWPQLAQEHAGITLINAACNGNTTGGMLAGFHHAEELYKPDAVFMMGGVNDIFYSGTDAGARANLGCLAHLCYSKAILPMIGVPIDLSPPIPNEWSSFVDVPWAQTVCDDYARWLRLFCRTFQIPIVDFRSLLHKKAAEAGVKPSSWYLDGIHLNAAGHRAMAEIFAENLPQSPIGRTNL